MTTKTLCLTFSFIIVVLCQEQVMIPDHLLKCYQNHGTPPLLPMTISVLIDLIRKIEFYPTYQMNMRTLTTSLLHRFRMDGLERDPTVKGEIGITPYRASGFQFHKYRTLFHQLIPGSSQLFPNESLSLMEQCTLHFMISSTVDPWERGDEQEVCLNSYQDYSPTAEINGLKFSTCPIEQGVVLTDSGTINMGNVLAGLASALEPLETKQSMLLSSEETKLRSGNTLSNEINNRWAATIAGDLAEVVVFQTPQTNLDMKVGFSGQWNDTYLPADYYMTIPNSPDISKRYWQITDAEFLGGVDGLTLVNSIGKWPEKYSRFRLSQLLDMFYSDHGVNFDPEDRACNRELNFESIFSTNQETLQNQTQYFAEILSSKTPHYFIQSQFIEEASKELMKQFKLYYPGILKKTKKCSTEYAQGPRLDLLIIMDATWSNYNALQLLMTLSEKIGVNRYGSNITVVNGDSGTVIINETNSISDIYTQWMNKSATEIQVNDLRLERSFLTLASNLEEKTEREHQIKSIFRRSESLVVLVLGYSSTIRDQDMKGAKNLIKGIKEQYPAIKFVYLTSRVNAPRFVHLTTVPGSQTDSVVAVEETRLPAILPVLQGALFTVPRSLTPAYCDGKKRQYLEYEEYISPGHPLHYWIHPDYLCGCDDFVKFTFKNLDYGQLRVCISRDQNLLGACQEADLNKETTLFLTNPCEKQGEHMQQWNTGCLPVYFTVTAVKTLNKCLENECKYPDQVKFNIIIQGLKCVDPFSAICSSSSRLHLQYIFVVSSMIVLYFVSQNV